MPADGSPPQTVQAATFQVPVLDFWIERRPEPLLQLPEHVETIAQPRKTVAFDKGFNQPGGDLEILTLDPERFSGKRDHGRPIGNFSLVYPLPLRRIRIIGPAGLPNRIVNTVIPDIFPCRVFTRNRSEQRLKVESLW